MNRDAANRRRLELRNRLWTVLLRCSLPTALRALARHARIARRDPVARRALTEAIAALPWIVRERRTIPKQLEQRIRALDAAHAQ